MQWVANDLGAATRPPLIEIMKFKIITIFFFNFLLIYLSHYKMGSKYTTHFLIKILVLPPIGLYRPKWQPPPSPSYVFICILYVYMCL